MECTHLRRGENSLIGNVSFAQRFTQIFSGPIKTNQAQKRYPGPQSTNIRRSIGRAPWQVHLRSFPYNQYWSFTAEAIRFSLQITIQHRIPYYQNLKV